jgi:hypothetical protein
VQGELRLLKDGAQKPEQSGTPARQFMIRLDGRTPGHLADEVAVQFVRTIQDGMTFQPVLESLKLQGLQRVNAADTTDSSRMFGMEGFTRPRKLQ